MQPLLEVIA